MRVSELNEAQVKKAVFTFGRLNPPHFGHHALIQTLQKEAQKQGCDWYLFVSSKTGDEKNPLTYEQKVWWIQALFPETKGHLVVDASIKTPLVAATWLYKQGYRAATFVAGEDDMSSYGEMIKSGNAHGEKNPDAVKSGKGFIFKPLDFAISPRLASATNARKNVTDGDPEAFVRSILGPKISPDLAKLVHDQLYPTLRKALGLGESVGESAELNKSTPSVSELAKKYATDPAEIYRQVNRGVKVEFEHTNDIETATEIAMDHLGERLDYYDLLDKLEKSPKKKFGENFADGKGPGRPGDSQRHGIPKKATIAQLEKAAKAPGRKGQLARWQLNMRRGKKKANENGSFAFGGGAGGNADAGTLVDRQVAMYPWDINTPHPKEIDENKVPASEIVKYVRKIHPEGEWNIDYTITNHPFWTKKDVPIQSLHIFDPDQEEIKDPYDRVQDTNLDHVRRLMPNIANNLKKNPIVVDDRGYVLDGNHRALAAAKAGLTSIPVWMPAKEGLGEAKNPKKPKTIIDGALKTLIAKGRSEDEAIADLKKEIDTKFYELGESLDETLKKVNGKWALVSRHDPKKVLQYYHGSQHPSKDWVNKVERRVHSFESAEAKIDDDWFKTGSFETYKKANPVKYQTADTAGVLQTLEGPVKYDTGFKIITGPKGEQYPIPPEKFASLYDDNGDGTATPKKIMKVAKLADHDGVVNTSWGEPLNYTAGNDYIVRHGPNDYGAIKKDIFAQTYVRESMMEDDSVKPRVYLDMDGVLADFFGEWSRISGVDHYKDINDVEAKLQLVREHPTFWVDLPLLPHAKSLIKTVIDNYGEYRICSKPLEGDARSEPGKMEWIHKHLSDMPPAEVILTADKAKFATQDGSPCILVDDYGVNINSWKAAGGIGIKYDDSAFSQVAKILTSIAKSGVPK